MKPIYFHDTLKGKKVEFTARTPGEVSMYVCGLTTSNDSHIGHARTAIVFDVIRRVFQRNGYKVYYVSNFTDIDDKIIQRSNEEKIPAKDLSEKYIARYLEVIRKMHISEPDMYPRVTDHIPEIINGVSKLIENGFAYEMNGDVYFSVRSSKDYGKLSKRNPDDLLSGARVRVCNLKRDPLDFALWKMAKPDEPSWDSPWGKGRPGWHIECSVMALKYLGNHFDIHGGGQDLVFPHHENEIAQAEGITCSKPFCNYWIHTGWVTLDKAKMSKSIGNVFRIKDALKLYHPNALRYFFFATLYTSPLECNTEAILLAEKNLDKWAVSMRRFLDVEQNAGENTKVEESLLGKFRAFQEKFHASLRDNFNTPEAFSVIHTACKELNKFLDMNDSLSKKTREKLQETLNDFFETLGFYRIEETKIVIEDGKISTDLKKLSEKIEIEIDEPVSIEKLMEKLIEKRNSARKSRDFATADLIRDELNSIGVVLEDGTGETTYRLEK